MRRSIVLFLFGFFTLLASCGPSVTQACDDYATAWCTKNYGCATGASLQALQQSYGATPEACSKSYASITGCSSAQSPCPPGKSYDTGLAEKCVTAYQNSTCADIAQPSFIPAECDLNVICH